MVSRRTVLLAAAALGTAASVAAWVPAYGASRQAFDAKAFADAQKAGKPILIAIHATWCPTCAAQKPILSELLADRKFTDMAYFVVDFDSQKDIVRRFGAQMQSTLIAFHGSTERARSVGDTNHDSIAALLDKTL
jgi:thiol-disulfide isomerase/thioredoxin